jgi:broad-specificity NMP kinase
MRRRINEIIEECDKANIIIDGHYAASVAPKRHVTNVFVLRRNPVELRKTMEHCGFAGNKLWENLASEILDVCLFDALKNYSEDKICEVDVSGKSVEEVVGEILDVMEGRKKCYVGIVDWLGKLEREGLLNEYLRI